MRIAVLGDVHANLAALDAAIAAARRAGCDRILHAGDLVGYGPQPDEVVERVAGEGIEGVRGDFDNDAAWGLEEAGCAFDGEGDALLGREASRWTRRRISYATRNFLKDLPFSIDFVADDWRVSLFHASPVDLYEPLDAGTSEARLREIIEDSQATVLVSGHSHRAGHRIVDGCHFINTGSVGLPAAVGSEGCLGIVEIDWIPKVRVETFPYDIEATLSAAHARDLPGPLLDLFAPRAAAGR